MTLYTDKRLYDAVAVGRDNGAFTVLLGGRPLRTPEKNILRLPTAALAAGVANEWLILILRGLSLSGRGKCTVRMPFCADAFT